MGGQDAAEPRPAHRSEPGGADGRLLAELRSVGEPDPGDRSVDRHAVPGQRRPVRPDQPARAGVAELVPRSERRRTVELQLPVPGPAARPPDQQRHPGRRPPDDQRLDIRPLLALAAADQLLAGRLGEPGADVHLQRLRRRHQLHARHRRQHGERVQLRLAPLVGAQSLGQLVRHQPEPAHRFPHRLPRRRRPRQRGRRIQHAGHGAIYPCAVVSEQQPVRDHSGDEFRGADSQPREPELGLAFHQLRQRRPVQLLQRAVVDLGAPQLQGRRLRRAPDEHRGQGRKRLGRELRLQPRSGEPVRHRPSVRERPGRIVPLVSGEHRPAGAARQPVDRQLLRAGQVAAGRPPDTGHRDALQQVHGVRAGEPVRLVPAVALRPRERRTALRAHPGERRADGDEPERPDRHPARGGHRRARAGIAPRQRHGAPRRSAGAGPVPGPAGAPARAADRLRLRRVRQRPDGDPGQLRRLPQHAAGRRAELAAGAQPAARGDAAGLVQHDVQLGDDPAGRAGRHGRHRLSDGHGLRRGDRSPGADALQLHGRRADRDRLADGARHRLRRDARQQPPAALGREHGRARRPIPAAEPGPDHRPAAARQLLPPLPRLRQHHHDGERRAVAVQRAADAGQPPLHGRPGVLGLLYAVAVEGPHVGGHPLRRPLARAEVREPRHLVLGPVGLRPDPPADDQLHVGSAGPRRGGRLPAGRLGALRHHADGERRAGHGRLQHHRQPGHPGRRRPDAPVHQPGRTGEHRPGGAGQHRPGLRPVGGRRHNRPLVQHRLLQPPRAGRGGQRAQGRPAPPRLLRHRGAPRQADAGW